MQARTEHLRFPAVVERLQKQRRALRAPVDGHDRPRFGHAGQVEELVALAERLFAWTFRSALENRDGVADPLHDAPAATRELFEREDFGAREHRLGRRRRRGDREQAAGQDEQVKSHAASIGCRLHVPRIPRRSPRVECAIGHCPHCTQAVALLWVTWSGCRIDEFPRDQLT